MTRKRLTRIGEEIAVVLDESLLEELGLGEGSEVEVLVRDGAVVVTPIEGDARKRRFERAVEKVDEQYRGVFERLAKS